VRDYERLPAHSEAHLNWAVVTLMTRRLARGLVVGPAGTRASAA
jgi:hypothetical protein